MQANANLRVFFPEQGSLGRVTLSFPPPWLHRQARAQPQPQRLSRPAPAQPGPWWLPCAGSNARWAHRRRERTDGARMSSAPGSTSALSERAGPDRPLMGNSAALKGFISFSFAKGVLGHFSWTRKLKYLKYTVRELTLTLPTADSHQGKTLLKGKSIEKTKQA